MLVSIPTIFKVVLLPLLLLVSTNAAPVVNPDYTTKQLTTSNNQTYVYSFAPASDASKPTLLLLHGYPASRHDWDEQITALVSNGFGILAPDLLGFGDSSKPTNIQEYNTKTLSFHLAEILDAENLPTVIGVGHDWGAGLLGKAVAWIPERFTKISIVSIPYIPAGLFFDIDAANKASLEERGYQQFGYWYFFNSWDSADVISQHLESFFHLAFTSNSSSWGTEFADLGAARKWLNANQTTALPPWLSESYKQNWLQDFSEPGAVAASLNYYQALLRGIHAPDEKVLTDEDRTIDVPVLAVGAARDQITAPEQQKASFEPWAKGGFEQVVVDSGHWVSLEKPAELSEILLRFAEQ